MASRWLASAATRATAALLSVGRAPGALLGRAAAQGSVHLATATVHGEAFVGIEALAAAVAEAVSLSRTRMSMWPWRAATCQAVLPERQGVCEARLGSLESIFATKGASPSWQAVRKLRGARMQPHEELEPMPNEGGRRCHGDSTQVVGCA